ncbi:MAG: epoxide hydrolase family protein [Acidimicrobiales bacterium]
MSTDEAIVPFRIETPAEVIDDLRQRLRATRWPEAEPVDDWSQGIPLAYVQDVCRYWAEEYDWAARSARLNDFPQFTTEIDGLDIHFLHVRSPHEDALPLVITHGWPGSVAEFQNVIGPLTDPTAHGGSADDAFHVVCPSIPGFGFSAKPAETGWGLVRIADAWGVLMARLGYDRFLAQGGDWGSMITTTIGVRNPDHCMAIHLNMPLALPDPDTMDDLQDEEIDALGALDHYQKEESGYSKQQSTRPQTLGYGLVDSPAGQAAWILEKFYAWTDNDGTPDGAVARDELLDNVMLYWLPGTGASSARLYWESFANPPFDRVQVPVGCSIFPEEIFRTSRRWAEKQFGELLHFNRLDRGGHFAAMEQPELYVTEVRDCFRSLR